MVNIWCHAGWLCNISRFITLIGLICLEIDNHGRLLPVMVDMDFGLKILECSALGWVGPSIRKSSRRSKKRIFSRQTEIIMSTPRIVQSFTGKYTIKRSKAIRICGYPHFNYMTIYLAQVFEGSNMQ